MEYWINNPLAINSHFKSFDMHVANTSSHNFKIIIYSNRFKPFIDLGWPGNMLGLVAIRILQEVLPDEEVFEPWFDVKPGIGIEFTRTEQPLGMTSLKGRKFTPNPEYAEKLLLHPHPKITHFTFTIYDVNRIVFQGDFNTDDLFRAGLEYCSKALFERSTLTEGETPFYYEVLAENETNPSIAFDNMLTPTLPMSGLRSESIFEIPRLEKKRDRILFKKVIGEKIPLADLKSFANTEPLGHRGIQRKGRIILHKYVYDSLVEGLELSDKAENGGYLLGRVYRQPDSPEEEGHADFRWILEITDVFKSGETYGNAVLLMFTHDSWSEIKRKIDTDYQDKKLVSWFHTHLFKATNDFGLSSLDQKLHANFFSKSWQVALLLNIDKSGNRELRCFQMDDQKKELVESTYEVLKEA